MSAHFERLKVLSAGILSLILMVGIARFAYSPMLPEMQAQAGLGIAEGGWLAAMNYVGYLCGAILVSQINDLVIKDHLYRLGLIMAIMSTVGMGMTESVWTWAAFRFLAGLSSAAGMLLGSGLIMNWLIRYNHRSELGIHFAGMGLGIAFCALLVEALHATHTWSEQWTMLAASGVLILVPAWRWLPSPDTSSLTNTGNTMVDTPPSAAFMRLFLMAYFCAGIGYAVNATFIVAIVEQVPELAGKGSWTFLVVGLAAAPACIIWDFVARRFGDFNALILAYGIQVLGIAMQLTTPTLALTILSAGLFGFTFMGIVSLVLSMAGRHYPTRPAKMMSKMTVAFGLAQILAPALTGLMAERSGTYTDGLYMAAAMMVLGTVLLMKLKTMERF